VAYNPFGEALVQEDGQRPQLTHRGRRSGGWSGLLTRILAVAGGLLVLAGAVAISLVVFAVALAGLLLFGLWFWWKKRDVIKQMRQMHAQMRRPSPYDNGNVIEGEVVGKKDSSRSS
jgi:hypothetical protein